LRDDATALGAPTDEEVRALTAERWPELDRPVSVRTTHAVVLLENAAEDGAARALAATLAAALRGATSADDFIARARNIKDPTGSLQVRAEELPPVTPDGRLWDPSERPPKPLAGSLDVDFTRAAHSLRNAGDQTGIVKSAFGYHVVFLAERYPALDVPFEQRRRDLAHDIFARRAKRAFEALLSRLRTQTPVTIERSAEALTALVGVEP
jgi:hypothetical protein